MSPLETQQQKVKPNNGSGKPFDVIIPGHHAMEGQPVPEHLGKDIEQPWLPRANLAVSRECPFGTTWDNWSESHKKYSTLEQHCLFFDPDGDGVNWPHDTFLGFKALGYHVFWCIIATLIINSGFSYWTSDSWIPDPFFRIHLKNIHRSLHGSDTGTYDSEGRFLPARFEEIFTKYDRDQKGGLTWTEGLWMIHGNRLIADPVGWLAAFFEWLATYLLFWPEDGVVTREQLRSVYDGSIFFQMAKDTKFREQQKDKHA